MMRLVAVTLACALSLSYGNLVPMRRAILAEDFSPWNSQELSRLITGNSTGVMLEMPILDKLLSRQIQCLDPGYVPCRNIPTACCPAGDDCFPTVCCDAGMVPCGTRNCYPPASHHCCADGAACELGWDCVPGGCCPEGHVRCGTSDKCYNPRTHRCCQNQVEVWGCDVSQECCSSGYCYKPSTEHCCDNGSCSKAYSCCEKECCASIAYCGADGWCSGCPLTATTTRTTTIDKTVLSTTTATITQVNEPEEPIGFSCLPLTVTNSENATLELDTDCMLSYIPPETTNDSGLSPRNAMQRPRQALCVPTQTTTILVVITNTATAGTTRTRTVVTEVSEAGFTCPPMSVTNAAGDELSLDEECQLEILPAPPTSSTTTASDATQTTPQGSAAVAMRDTVVSSWAFLVLAAFGLSTYNVLV